MENYLKWYGVTKEEIGAVMRNARHGCKSTYFPTESQSKYLNCIEFYYENGSLTAKILIKDMIQITYRGVQK